MLACFGGTFALCDSVLFVVPRMFLCRWGFFARLLSCYFCTGFWVSAGLSAALYDLDWWLLVRSLAGASTAYILNIAAMAVESAVIKYDDTEAH